MVKSISVCSIQLPQTSSAMPTPITLGTKARVNSWIWVIDWNVEIVNPITRAGHQDRGGELQRDDHGLQRELEDGGVGHGPATRSSRRGT